MASSVGRRWSSGPTDLPLTFLDAHIQQGNALLSTTPELLANGIPDTAWEPIHGGDKKVASALKKQNKQEAKEELLLVVRGDRVA